MVTNGLFIFNKFVGFAFFLFLGLFARGRVLYEIRSTAAVVKHAHCSDRSCIEAHLFISGLECIDAMRLDKYVGGALVSPWN